MFFKKQFTYQPQEVEKFIADALKNMSITEEIEYIRGMLDLVLFCNLIDTRKHTDFKNKLNAKAEALLKQEREERKRKAEERKRKTAEK